MIIPSRKVEWSLWILLWFPPTDQKHTHLGPLETLITRVSVNEWCVSCYELVTSQGCIACLC